MDGMCTKGRGVDILPGKGNVSGRGDMEVAEAGMHPDALLCDQMVEPAVGQAQTHQIAAVQVLGYLRPQVHVVPLI